MNPFQRARTKAREIREQLQPGRSEQALNASELLSRIEGELNLGVTGVPPDYHDLGSGSAVLDRIQRFIFVSTKYAEGTDTHAGLVAHELGHWFLDADASEKTVAQLLAVDGGSAGSPAMLKVEAYGARERQELQANVFAREFLLPRSIARELFQSGKGPRQVAHELGIPLDFAQQQMLDAVLLPALEDKTSTLHDPSEDQLLAARAQERFANVVAGPGTGKTSTLIHRVKYLVEQRQVDPRHILVLTFTNKAAFELVERLRAAGIHRASDVWAGTFHAFGLEFLRKYHQNFGLKPSFGVADNLQSMAILAGGLAQIKLEHYLRVRDPYDWLGQVVETIARAKEEMLTADDYREQLARFPALEGELQQRRQDVATLFKSYGELLAHRNSVDFVDLITLPARAIAEDRAQYSELADRFQYILVDEYQDVTTAMVHLLRELAYSAKSLWVVGDVRQAIHHWRGASLHSLLKFESHFRAQAGPTSRFGKYALSVNRRSSAEILKVVGQVGRIHALEEDLPLDSMTAAKGQVGVKPVLTHCSERPQVPAAIADGVQELLLKHGVALRDQAVLCRGALDVEAVCSELQARSIDVVHVGELARAREVKLLLCLMQLLVERQPRALVGLMSVPDLAMPMSDVQVLLDASDGSMQYQRGRWLLTPPEGLSAKALAVIQNLKSLIGGRSHSSNPWPFVCDLLLEHGFALPSQDDPSVAASVTRLRLWQFAYAVRNGEGDIRESRLSRFLLRFRLRQRVGDPYGERELPPEAAQLDGVRLLTIHGSKGLEFEAVHVCKASAENFGMQSRTWVAPDSIRELITPEMLGSSETEYEHEETVERNNLLYVAVSRPKRHLRMYFDTDYYGQVAPQLQKTTHYERREHAAPSLARTAAKMPPAFQVTEPVALTEFRTFSDCPLQFWYRQVLGLKREQEYEVGVRAQVAIMEVLRQLASGSTQSPQELVEQEWRKSHLPVPSQDPSLWGDALFALERGAAKVAALSRRGTVIEATSLVAGLQVQLPWGFLVQERHETQLHLVLFARRSAAIETVMKPVVNGLALPGTKRIWFHSVLSDLQDEAPPAKRVNTTKGFGAAVGLLEGRNNPSPGRHCGRCSYATICPSAPKPA